MQVDDNLESVLLQNLLELLELSLVRNLSAAERPDLVVEDLCLHVDDVRTRIADGRQDASPVRIAPEPARLRQGALRDRARGSGRVLLAPRALHRDRDELRRALAVRRHLPRQRNADGFQCFTEGVKVLAALRDRLVAGLAAGQQEDRVVRRLVPVDDEAVETLVDRKIKCALEHRGRDCRIRRDEAEHRRHVGLDHSRPLRHAADRHGLAADCRPRARLFWLRVRRHHGFLRGESMRRRIAELLRGGLHAGEKAVHRQGTPDDARRCDQHVARVDAELARCHQRRQLRILQALLSRAGVRAAGVRENRLDLSALHDLAVIEHRRGGDLVGREDRGGGAWFVGDDERDVVPALVLDFRRNAGRAESLCGADSALNDPQA